MNDSNAEQLDGGWRTRVVRVGDSIRRSPGPWSPAVIELLAHLEREGFPWSPRPVGTGFDADGNEVLTFIDGASLQPQPWSDEAIAELGVMTSELHRLARSFRPPPDAVWQKWFGRELGDTTLGFGHGDLGPWNVMAIDGMPSGFIDWDTAGPMDPAYDLAETAWLNVQLHDDDIAERVGLASAAERAAQLGVLLDSYGLPRSERSGFVDRMVEVAIHDSADQAVAHGVGPDTTTGVADDGYPFAWGMAWRARAAAWMLRHRRLLEKSIGA